MVNLPKPEPRHEVLSNIAITEKLTGSLCSSRPEIFLTDEDLTRSRDILAKAPRDAAIVCVAFGAQAMRRAWPLERWAEVIRMLSLKRDVFALLVCANSERSAGSQLQSMLSIDSHLMSGSTLRQVAAAIRACDLFMGPDSGLAHLSAAVDCPSVVVSPHPLNGDPDHGNSPIRFGPFSDRARVIQPLQGMSPCVGGCDAIIPHCILQIHPEEVKAACEEMLGLEKIGIRLAHEPIRGLIDLRVTG
jgi:heptosyltransferase-2